MRDVALSLSYGSKKEGQEGREAQSRSKAQSRKEDGRKKDIEEALTAFLCLPHSPNPRGRRMFFLESLEKNRLFGTRSKTSIL